MEDAALPGVTSLLDWCPRRPMWGTPVPGTCALAWALLHDASGDPRLADDWAWSFSEAVVSCFPTEGFVLQAADVLAWLES